MVDIRTLRWLFRLMILVVSAEIFYLAAANLLLGSTLLPQWLSREPERLSIEWSSAWTAVPGHLNVKGLKVRGRTPYQHFQFSMERATGRVALSALLFKTVEFRGVNADNVSASLRNHTQRDAKSAKTADSNPPRPSRETADKASLVEQTVSATTPEITQRIEPPENPNIPGGQAGWNIVIVHAEVGRIRELELNDHRFTGSARIQLEDLSFRVGGPVAIDRANLQLRSGELTVGSDSIAQDLHADAEILVNAFVPSENPGTRAAKFISGTIAVSGATASYDFINHYLTKAPWLRLQGHGNLKGTIRVEQGKLLEGSELAIDSPSLTVNLDDGPATDRAVRDRVIGAGTVRGVVTTSAGERKAQLRVALQDVAMMRSGQERAFVKAEHFQLTATTASIDLSAAPPEPAVLMEWQGAEMPDVSVLNDYVLSGLPFRLDSGSAQLSGHLSYANRVVTGAFDLAGEKIAGTILEKPVVGQMAVRLNIEGIDLQQQRLDLSGTHFQMLAATDAEQGSPLQTEIAIQEARLESALPWNELKQHPGRPPVSGALKLAGKVSNIDFLNGFLPSEQGFAFGGDGSIRADLRLTAGALAPGSTLKIESDRLMSQFLDFDFRGAGEVHGSVLSVGETLETRLQLALRDMTMRRGPTDVVFLRAKGFQLDATTPSLAFSEIPAEPTVTMEWQGAVMPNVAALNAYFPSQAAFSLTSGSARLDGRIRYADRNLTGKLNLASDNIAGTILQEPLTGHVAADLVVAEANLDTRRLDLSGTRLRMQAISSGANTPLITEIGFPVARLESALSWDELKRRGKRPPVSGVLKLDGRVANIGFLNRFLRDKQGLEFGGDGRMTADLRLAGGQIAPGSQLEVKSANLSSRFLHFEASGSGILTASVEGKSKAPTGNIAVFLLDFGLRRLDELTPYIKGRNFAITTMGKSFDLENGISDLSTEIKLPSAEIPDMTIYNAYLPKNAGIAIVSGKGLVKANFRLDGISGSGAMEIHGTEVEIDIKNQTIKGNLRIDSRLNNGNLENKTFDVSGTQLSIGNAQLETEGAPQDQDWWGRISVERGLMTWKKPLDLNGKIKLALRDSGLLVHLFLKDTKDHAWLDDLLTIRDVAGTSDVALSDKTIVLKNTQISGEELLLLANLRLSEEQMRGALYAKYGIFGLGVELADGEQTFKIVSPRKWYDAFARDFAAQRP